MDIINKTFQVLPHSAHANENVEVLYNFENITNALKEKIEVKFYLSHNSWISTGDYEIGSYEINSIEKGTQSGVQKVNLPLPPESDDFWLDDEDGTYYIGALIDNNNAIDLGSSAAYRQFITHDAIDITGLDISDDASEDSNQNYIDLVGKEFSVDPSDGDHRVHPGESIDIKYQIANLGDHNAGEFKVEFYVSSNPFISEDDHKIGERQHPIFQHQIDSVDRFSSTDILNGTFQLPDASHEIWSNFDGTYYIGMIIDGAHQVSELSHLNNQNKGQYLDSDTVEVVGTHLQEGADLVGAGLHLVDNGYEHNPVEPGELFHVQYDVLNAGSGDAPYFANNFYIATEDFVNSHQQITDQDIDFHDLYGLLGDRDSFLINLESYDYTGTQDITLQVPHNVSAGKYYLVMQTDDYNEVHETNEFNNLNYVEIYIDGPGDLFNQNLAVLNENSEDDPLLPGEVFTAEYEVVNKGGEDVPFSATHFYLLSEEYLNENNEIKVADIDNVDLFALYGDRFTEVITLEAGHSTGKREISLQVPHDIEPGKYFLGIQSDVFEEVDEDNELNNSLFAPVGDYVELHIGFDDIVTQSVVGEDLPFIDEPQPVIVPGDPLDNGFNPELDPNV